jgi:hypothetical protein
MEQRRGREVCVAAAHEDGVRRLAEAVEAAVSGGEDWATRVSDGLRAGLRFLADDPSLAHMLSVESLAATRSVRLEHERSLARLARALLPPPAMLGGEALPEEAPRLLAGGLASHVSRRVLAGAAERLPQDHDLLLGFLLAPTQAADVRVAAA